MRRFGPLSALLLFCLLATTAGFARDGAVKLRSEEAVQAMLTDFHRSAADADAGRHFSHLAPGAVILGTDATERFTRDQYIALVKPYFDQGTGWSTEATDQVIHLSKNGKIAWFEERLHRADLAEMRGTGVAVILGGEWKLVQYNTSFPVPNALARKLMEMVRDLPAD